VASTPLPTTQPSPRSGDIDVRNFGGGGAVDPLTVLLGVGLAGLGYAARRRQAGHRPA
jgi:hypothetical protein